MFTPAFGTGETPSAEDLVIGVRGDDVRFGSHASSRTVTDLHLIGHLDGVPVWAGEIDGGTADPWGSVERPEIAARAVYSVQWRRTHRFCGECAGPLDDCPGYPTRRCPRCTTVPYVPQALTPAVIVAIISAGRILLVRHSYGIARARWALVAGMVEATETLEAAVIREVREEVGLEITAMGYALSKGFSLDNPACLMAGFMAECAADAEPRVDGVELTEARWFSRDEFAALPADQVPPSYSVANALIGRWLPDAWTMAS